MKTWKDGGAPLWAMFNQNPDTDKTNAVDTNVWAPEVVYDEDTKLYYLFFSATPKDRDYTLLYVATSKSPNQDYQLVDFSDVSSCGIGNTREDAAPYTEYFAKYSLLDPKTYWETVVNKKATSSEYGYANSIDPHPFVDANGKKYLYWTDNSGYGGNQIPGNRIWVVGMENWLKPNFNTAKPILCAGYRDIWLDGNKQVTGGTKNSVAGVGYEADYNGVNEGVTVVRRNGKYYLSFSVNSYTDSAYQVGQAVADSPMGPFRKLTEAEGGLLLSAGASGNPDVSGTGHHSFVQVKNRMYIFYHLHDTPSDPSSDGYKRHVAMDEVKWVSNKDGLEVMYVNGPTSTVQPALEPFSVYRNIANEASVTVNGNATNINALTDGLLSINKNGNALFAQCIPETTITQKTVFQYDFDTVRAVQAVMIYNSRNACFSKISNISLICESQGREVIYVINDLPWTDTTVPGSAAIAKFNELNVKSIKFTVEVPEGRSSVGISEIRILGK